MQPVGRPELMRNMNYRAVVEFLATNGPRSRAEIADQLQLSRPSVSRVVEVLLKVGLVEEGRRIATKMGRPRILLNINPTAGVVAGVSIRPKRVGVQLADLNRSMLQQAEVTPQRNADELADQVADLIRDIHQVTVVPAPLAAVVIGISGVWDEERRLVHSAPNLPALEGVDFLAKLKRRLSRAVLLNMVQLDNDVNYAALGEMFDGAARGQDSFFYLNLGSGVGGGLVVGGSLYRGSQGFAGEVGYLLIERNCRDYRLEELLSRHVLASRAAALGLEDDAGALFNHALRGHSGAEAVTDQFCRDLGVALCSIVATFNPSLIVIGGSVGRHLNPLLPRIKDFLKAKLPTLPEVELSQLGADASLRGAVARGVELARDCLIRKEIYGEDGDPL
jgi:predicted NBD/HSP70 family sugar kinase